MVLVLGSELAASDTWQKPLCFAGRLIRIDIDAAALRSHPMAEIALETDLGPALDELLRLLPVPKGRRAERRPGG